MKPLFAQTLAWLATTLVAVLLALNVPEHHGVTPFESDFASGATAPR